MSRGEVVKCDSCGKETHDFYAEQRWVQLAANAFSSLTITISTGRRAKGESKVTGYSGDKKELHFCGTSCLLKYLDNLLTAAIKQEKKIQEKK